MTDLKSIETRLGEGRPFVYEGCVYTMAHHTSNAGKVYIKDYFVSNAVERGLDLCIFTYHPRRRVIRISVTHIDYCAEPTCTTFNEGARKYNLIGFAADDDKRAAVIVKGLERDQRARQGSLVLGEEANAQGTQGFKSED